MFAHTDYAEMIVSISEMIDKLYTRAAELEASGAVDSRVYQNVIVLDAQLQGARKLLRSLHKGDPLSIREDRP